MILSPKKKETLCPLAVTPHSSPYPAPGQPTDLLSVSMDLPFGTYFMNYMWVFVTGFFHWACHRSSAMLLRVTVVHSLVTLFSKWIGRSQSQNILSWWVGRPEGSEAHWPLSQGQSDERACPNWLPMFKSCSACSCRTQKSLCVMGCWQEKAKWAKLRKTEKQSISAARRGFTCTGVGGGFF